METIKIKKTDYENKLEQNNKVLIDLLSQFNHQKNNPNYIKKIIVAIANWQLKEHNIDFVTITFENDHKSSAFTKRKEKIININPKLITNAKNFKRFSILISDLLHEFAHITQKDLKHFYFNAVVYTLNKICNYSYDDAYTIALGMYSENKCEIQADSIALNQMKNLKQLECNKRSIIAKMIKIQEKKKEKTNKNFSEHRQLFDIYKEDIQNKLTKYINKKTSKNDAIIDETINNILETYY